jgi:hypothetical protein
MRARKSTSWSWSWTCLKIDSNHLGYRSWRSRIAFVNLNNQSWSFHAISIEAISGDDHATFGNCSAAWTLLNWTIQFGSCLACWSWRVTSGQVDFDFVVEKCQLHLKNQKSCLSLFDMEFCSLTTWTSGYTTGPTCLVDLLVQVKRSADLALASDDTTICATVPENIMEQNFSL